MAYIGRFVLLLACIAFIALALQYVFPGVFQAVLMWQVSLYYRLFPAIFSVLNPNVILAFLILDVVTLAGLFYLMLSLGGKRND